MRELATLHDQHDAQVLVDYLLTQKIPAEIRIEEGKPVIWVCDEDHVDQARAIWNEFRTQPKDSKYVAAVKPAKEIRKKLELEEKKYASLIKEGDHFWGRPHPSRVPVTIALIVLSVVATLWIDFGKNRKNLLQLTFMDKAGFHFENPFASKKDIEELNRQNMNDQLNALKKGELWRVITPIFIHFTWLHLIFNMYALYSLGGLIESRRGPLWLILFVVLTGVFSNVLQFFVPTLFDFQQPRGIAIGTSLFGGMSGVDFALFGYLVAKTFYAPEPGLILPRDTIIAMLVWLFICMTGVIGSIANTAHVGGLVMGFVVGLLPKFWHRLRVK